MGKALHGKVIDLAGRLPHIWADPAIMDVQRKALLRCLVEKVVLGRGEHDVALVRIVWRGGAVTDLEVKMKVNSVDKPTRGAEMRSPLGCVAEPICTRKRCRRRSALKYCVNVQIYKRRRNHNGH
jgi:hypothetical protein